MVTVRDIVQRSYEKLSIVGRGEVVSSEDAQTGVSAFNEMLHGWKLRGVDVSHSDLGLNDPFPLEDAFREGAIYILAARISPEYRIPASFDADDWFRTVQAAYIVIDEVVMPDGLTDIRHNRPFRYISFS